MRLTVYPIHLAVCLLCVGVSVSAEPVKDDTDIVKNNEKKISEYVLAILEHYKQQDPVGIPGAPIPDPMDIPPLTHSTTVGKMNMKDVKLYGLAKFRVDHINLDLATMQADVALTIEKLVVIGNYTLGSFFSSSKGPFRVVMKDVYAKAVSNLEVEKDGQLEAQEMKMDINFKHIDMKFEGLGVLGSMFQGIINSMGTFIFDSIKPFILSEMNTNLRKDVNQQVRKLPQKFPNSISPFDQIISELRRKVRQMGYDPYKVADYNHTAGLVSVQMMNTWVMGLSSFHRVGNISFEIRNNTVHANLEVGTQKLEGSSIWEISLGAGMISRAGTVVFWVEYLKVGIVLVQTMDTRNPPMLDDIQLELGNIQVRCNGAGTLDYVVEFAVNFLPNILRYQLMDALESPIKLRIQEKLNAINVEKEIKERLQDLDEQQSTGFKSLV